MFGALYIEHCQDNTVESEVTCFLWIDTKIAAKETLGHLCKLSVFLMIILRLGVHEN